MVGQLLEVLLLLPELLTELEQLLLLTLADGVVLVSLLALLEGITVVCIAWLASFLLVPFFSPRFLFFSFFFCLLNMNIDITSELADHGSRGGNVG